jgi:hypothetical protein
MDLMSEPTTDSDRTPALDRQRFYCPHCEAFADQRSSSEMYAPIPNVGTYTLRGWRATTCASCGDSAFWLAGSMVWPSRLVGSPAPADLPAEVLPIYDEARAVGQASPRSAAALLRLALEQLVGIIETDGKTLNDKVGLLVRRGLATHVQRAMDALRVFGNNGAHVGEIDLSDDRETVESLFAVLHMVVEHVITRQREIDALYLRLPESARAAIERRDGSSP